MPKNFDDLIRDLHSADLDAVAEALEQLNGLADPRAVEPLLAYLRQETPAVEVDEEDEDLLYSEDDLYDYAFDTLLQFKEAAAPRVQNLLETGSPTDQHLAIQLLTEWAWLPAAPAALAFFEKGSALDKSLAASYLGAVQYAPAVDSLLAYLQSQAAFIRSQSQTKAIERIQQGLPYEAGETSTIFSVIQALGSIGEARVAPVLQSLLIGERGTFDDVIMQALVGFKSPETVTWLLDQLDNDDVMVAHEALLRLKQIGDPRAVEPMIRLLRHPVAMIRTEAIDGLGKMGGQAALDALKAMPAAPAPGTGLYDLPEVEEVRRQTKGMLQGMQGLFGGMMDMGAMTQQLMQAMSQSTGDSAMARMAMSDLLGAIGVELPPGMGAPDEGTLIQQAIQQIEKRLGVA